MFDFDNTLIDKISDENILVCNISYKTLIGAKPLCIRLEKVDGFIRADDGTRYLVLFCLEKHHTIYKRIRYLTSQKSGITYVLHMFFLIIM